MAKSISQIIAPLGLSVLVLGSGCAMMGFSQPTSADYANASPTAPAAPAASSSESSAAKPGASDRRSADAQADLATTLLSSPSPTQHALFRGLVPGSSRSDVEAQFPSLEHDMVAMKGGSHAMFVFQDDVVHSLAMRIKDPDPLAAAHEHWGPATVWRTESGGTAHVWFAPQDKLRAVMTLRDGSADLSIEAYEPVRSLLGEGEDFAFEQGYSLLGATRGELEARFEGRFRPADGDRGHLDLPATEHSDRTLLIVNFDKAGRVRGYSFDIVCWRDESAKDDIHQLFVDKWGEPKPIHNGNYELFRASSPKIMVRYGAGSAWGVRVDR